MTTKHHLPCPDCGSSDALSSYGDGASTFCFSCRRVHTYSTSNGEEKESYSMAETNMISKDLIDFRRLNKRDINIETCKKFNYGVYEDPDKGALHVAPYYRKNKLVAQKVRTKDKDFWMTGSPKGCELFGQHLWRDKGGKRVVVTEGEIDALSVAQSFNLSWPVVSVVNGCGGACQNIKDNLEFLESFEEVVLWFDNDEPGIKALEICATLITPGKCKVVTVPPGSGEDACKDANDVLRLRGSSEVCKYVWESRVYRPDGIINGDEIYDRLQSHRNGNDGSLSFHLPYPQLDQMLRGLRKKRLYTIIAAPKVGKSTLVKELGYHLLMHHGLKIASFAIEETLEETALTFMGMYLNRRLSLDPKSVPQEQFDQSYRATVGNGRLYMFDHFGSLDPDHLLSRFRYMAVGLGVDFILFDHISIVVSGVATDNERRLIGMIETKLRQLINETGVGVIQVAHVRKGSGKNDDPEEGGRISASDILGSGDIGRISDFVIALEGNVASGDNLRQTRVLYNRLSGESGTADTLLYDKESGRLVPVEVQPEMEAVLENQQEIMQDQIGFKLPAPSPEEEEGDDEDDAQVRLCLPKP